MNIEKRFDEVVKALKALQAEQVPIQPSTLVRIITTKLH